MICFIYTPMHIYTHPFILNTAALAILVSIPMPIPIAIDIHANKMKWSRECPQKASSASRKSAWPQRKGDKRNVKSRGKKVGRSRSFQTYRHESEGTMKRYITNYSKQSLTDHGFWDFWGYVYRFGHDSSVGMIGGETEQNANYIIFRWDLRTYAGNWTTILKSSTPWETP